MYCGIFAQSKNSGVRETAITSNGTTSVAMWQILNKQEYTYAARERLGKHVPAATDTNATEELISAFSVLRCHKQGTRF
jgi:hypothetical protein